MSKTISEIYEEYKIRRNLQDHMFRVAAVAYFICDNLNEILPKEKIVIACLLHDMGNIIKSNFEFFSEFLEPQGLSYWQKVKEEYIKKYGPDEEKAHGKIAKELGMSADVISLINKTPFPLLCKHKDENDMSVKIMHYADLRVGPYGVLSYDERLEEGKHRYKLKTQAEEDERNVLISCGREIEKQIFSKCRIKPEDINDETIAPIISSLKNFVIH